MTLGRSLLAVRQRLFLVAFAVVAGTVVGWFSGMPSSARVYQATHVLMLMPQPADSPVKFDLDQLAAFATLGSVPTEVAGIVHMPRDKVRSMVSAITEDQGSAILVTGRSTDPAQATSLADVTGEQLIAYVVANQRAAYQHAVAVANSQVQSAQTQFEQVQAGAARGTSQAVKLAALQLSLAQKDLSTVEVALQEYLSVSPPQSPLVTLETAEATPAPVQGKGLDMTVQTRAALFGGLGLLYGVSGAVGLDLVDSRVLSRRQAEESLGFSVLAEIPPLARGMERQLMAAVAPASPYVDAYRSLSSMVGLWARRPAAHGAGSGGRVILVTSALASEGKTTTVANLGAVLAERGHSVLLVSADFRRPQLHNFYDRSPEPGLIDLLGGSPPGPELDLATSVRGVDLITSGTPVANPAPLFERAAQVVGLARGNYDFVLVDAPPLLPVNDASELARHADGVLLVVRAGLTPVSEARRAARLLDQLQVPVVGTVLVASAPPRWPAPASRPRRSLP